MVPPPVTTFSRFNSWLSNSSGVASWLTTISLILVFAGTFNSVGTKRWPRITRWISGGSFAQATDATDATSNANVKATDLDTDDPQVEGVGTAEIDSRRGAARRAPPLSSPTTAT